MGGSVITRQRRHVLVVDDDPAILRAMQRRASRVAGVQLALAESGEAALALVHDRIPIELVVLDVMMGGIDGIETCRRLRLIAPSARVIVASGNMTPALMREAVQSVAGRAKLEASGNVTLDTVGPIAETGVDFISSGWITHSAPALDLGLDVVVS